MSSTVYMPEFASCCFTPARYKVLWGGRGAGRSWGFATAILVMGGQRELRVLCCREFQKSIDDSVHQLFRDLIERYKLPGWDVQKTQIVHRGTGTQIAFEGLRYNTNRIKSYEGVDICWVEEAESVTADSWQILIPTIRKKDSEIWISFNPDLESDPTYQRFVINTPHNAIVKKVGWEDNPWFHQTEMPAEKDWLYRVDPETAEHVWGGVPRKSSVAQIFRGKWHVEAFTPRPLERDDKGRPVWVGPYTGADFGFADDPTTCVEAWIKRRADLPMSQGELFIHRESWALHLDIDKIRDRWMRDIDLHVYRRNIKADSARPETISYLRRHGIPRIQPVFKWRDSVEDGIAYMRQYERIVIHPRCKRVKEEFRLYSYKVDEKTNEVLPKVVDKHNHCIDGIRYSLAPMIRQRRNLGANYKGVQYASSN